MVNLYLGCKKANIGECKHWKQTAKTTTKTIRASAAKQGPDVGSPADEQEELFGENNGGHFFPTFFFFVVPTQLSKFVLFLCWKMSVPFLGDDMSGDGLGCRVVDVVISPRKSPGFHRHSRPKKRSPAYIIQ